MQRAAPSKAYRSPYWLFSLLAVGIVLVITLPLMYLLHWGWMWSYLVGINAATVVLYGYDKTIAGSGSRRVPETVLHGAEIMGGTRAAFVAQRLFHHKTRKGSYQTRFWLIVAVQVLFVVVIWRLGWT